MTKKKKAPQLDAWCWYCDREFEDEKVLIQHQKARHFKCPFCPRRLNTAGGLAVHLGQVHKAEPGRLENTLPGRDSFEIEIYGMVGVPDSDLISWQVRRSERMAQSAAENAAMPPRPKRPRFEKKPLSADELRAQLQAHKALMSGATSTSAPPQLTQSAAVPSTAPAPASLSEASRPAAAPPAPGAPPPPPPVSGAATALPGAPPAPPKTALSPPDAQSPVEAAAAAAAINSSPTLTSAHAPIISSNAPSEPALQAPQASLAAPKPPAREKTRLVYTDTVRCPEERMACLPKYAYVEQA